MTARQWDPWCTKRLFAGVVFAAAAVLLALGTRVGVVGPLWLMAATVGVALAGLFCQVTALRDYRTGRIDVVEPQPTSDFNNKENDAA